MSEAQRPVLRLVTRNTIEYDKSLRASSRHALSTGLVPELVDTPYLPSRYIHEIYLTNAQGFQTVGIRCKSMRTNRCTVAKRFLKRLTKSKTKSSGRNRRLGRRFRVLIRTEGVNPLHDLPITWQLRLKPFSPALRGMMILLR